MSRGSIPRGKVCRTNQRFPFLSWSSRRPLVRRGKGLYMILLRYEKAAPRGAAMGQVLKVYMIIGKALVMVMAWLILQIALPPVSAFRTVIVRTVCRSNECLRWGSCLRF